MQYFSRLFLENKFNFGIFALIETISLNSKQIFHNENSQSIWPDTRTHKNNYGNHTNGIIHTISDSCAYMFNYLKNRKYDKLHKETLQETRNKHKAKQTKASHRIHRKS